MASKKQTIIHNGVLSKGRTNTTAGGMDPPHAIDNECPAEDTNSSSSQRETTNARSPSLYKGQILQILVDMKKHMKEKQAQSDCGREQEPLDSENIARKQEALK